jgi:hypothetical protein
MVGYNAGKSCIWKEKKGVHAGRDQSTHAGKLEQKSQNNSYLQRTELENLNHYCSLHHILLQVQILQRSPNKESTQLENL